MWFEHHGGFKDVSRALDGVPSKCWGAEYLNKVHALLGTKNKPESASGDTAQTETWMCPITFVGMKIMNMPLTEILLHWV